LEEKNIIPESGEACIRWRDGLDKVEFGRLVAELTGIAPRLTPPAPFSF
jgi:hypothetical protein